MLKVDCGGDRFSDVTLLSDAELASRLRELGADIGPVNDATRNVYRRKLQRWLQNGNLRYHIYTHGTQEEPLDPRPLASHLAPESNPYHASLEHEESHRQADGCTRKRLEDAENSTCQESKEESCKAALPLAESWEESARNLSPSRSSNGLRNRSHHETGEEDRLHECDRTKIGSEGELSSTSLRASDTTNGPELLRPEGDCLPHQVPEQRSMKPTILAALLMVILMCLFLALIIFNMEPEYRNPALL